MPSDREQAHSCDTQLSLAVKRNVRLSPSYAQEGDVWSCSCGRKYEHFCDEAEGCGWQEMKVEVE